MTEYADKRASPRIPAKVPVLVVGRDVYHKPVHEESETLLVNEGGALIALAAEMQIHDRARLTNKNTGARLDFRVAWRSAAKLNDRYSYGIALLGYPENFWGVST